MSSVGSAISSLDDTIINIFGPIIYRESKLECSCVWCVETRLALDLDHALEGFSRFKWHLGRNIIKGWE